MAKSNYLFGILFVGAVCVFGGAGGISLEEVNLEPGARNQDRFQLTQEMGTVHGDRAVPCGNAYKVKEVYDSQVGVRERGVNGGLEVEKYLRYVGLANGEPWCAAFVCWVYGQAGVKNPGSGWSPDLFPASKLIPTSHATGNRQPKTPHRGDIFAIYFAEKRRIAHSGFIDSWDDTWIITVEGNTNVIGSREGDGVYRKRRPTRSIYRVARYIN